MFLDASVVAAVLLQEDDGPALLKAMEAARGKLRYSPVVRMESVLALVRNAVMQRGRGPATQADFVAAEGLVSELLEALEAKEMHITTSMGEEAVRALYAGDEAGLERAVAGWPEGLRRGALLMLKP